MHFSSETFYRTAGPSHKAWYWNHGLRWQTSLVCRSCGKWHAICSIRLLQCALCWCFIFFEHVVLRSCTANCGTSSFLNPRWQWVFEMQQEQMFLLEFSSLTQRNPHFHPFVLFQAMRSGSVWFTWLKCSNHFALLLQCNHCLVFGDVLCS